MGFRGPRNALDTSISTRVRVHLSAVLDGAIRLVLSSGRASCSAPAVAPYSSQYLLPPSNGHSRKTRCAPSRNRIPSLCSPLFGCDLVSTRRQVFNRRFGHCGPWPIGAFAVFESTFVVGPCGAAFGSRRSGSHELDLLWSSSNSRQDRRGGVFLSVVAALLSFGFFTSRA